MSYHTSEPAPVSCARGSLAANVLWPLIAASPRPVTALTRRFLGFGVRTYSRSALPPRTHGHVRRDLGISQDDFADDLSIKRVTLGAWEVGRSAPRNVVAVAKGAELLTGVPAAWTLGLSELEEIPSPSPDGDGGGEKRFNGDARHEGFEPPTF